MNMQNSGWADGAPESPGRTAPVTEPASPPGVGSAPGHLVSNGDQDFHPARLTLGAALLAADRIRPRAPSDSFLVGVGLAQQTAAEVRGLARRALAPPRWAASRAADWATGRASVGRNPGLFARSRERLNDLMLDARATGRVTVAAGRQDADAFVRASVADGMAWAGTQAVPRIVDSLVPHLVDSVIPRLIEGSLPEIRSRVIPAVLDDLANDPKVRHLVTEQSRTAVEDAVKHVHADVAKADNKVIKAFRRLAGTRPAGQPRHGRLDPEPRQDRTTIAGRRRQWL
ncbi:MAG TPA: hypothetical protein VKB69_02500 [Micromonosporaceae bacterium]|nr:hypothetical protein [Micromonosporaceae bacterium]